MAGHDVSHKTASASLARYFAVYPDADISDQAMNLLEPLAHEDRLLLACARPHMDTPCEERAQGMIRAGINWAYLVDRAVRQGIATIVYDRLREMGAEQFVDRQSWATLREGYNATALSTMRQRFEIARLLEALSQQGIRVIALKGLHLREVIYPSPILRPSNDIDLLVQAGDVDAAETVLQTLGYVPLEEDQAAERRRPGFVHHLTPYLMRGRDVLVEIHWSLAPPQDGFAVDTEGLWLRSEERRVLGQKVELLGPTDLMLHLAMHAAGLHRFWTGIRHLVDLAQVSRYYGNTLDWEEMSVRAAAWGITRHVYVAFLMARDLLGAEIPTSALQQLQPEPADERFLSLALSRILAYGLPQQSRIPDLSSHRSEWRPAEGLRMFWKGLFPSRRQMARIYNLDPDSPWLCGLYLMRPFLLMSQHRQVVIGALLGKGYTRSDLATLFTDMSLDEWLDSIPARKPAT